MDGRPHPLDTLAPSAIVRIREQLLAAAAEGRPVYRLESGDPSFAPPDHVIRALDAAARGGKTHYIPVAGIPELRTALAAKLMARNGMAEVAPGDVFVTGGAMHGLHLVFRALLLPGDEVIVPDPMWTEAVENIRLAGGTPVGVPLQRADDFAYTPDAIEAALTPATVAIFLNTPHNPTGAVLPEATLRAILELARARGLWVIADEAYEDVVYPPARHVSIGALAGGDRHVVSVYSFSKSHAMPGLRIGYVATRSPLLRERLPKLLRCTTNGVNSLAQWAALAALTGDQAHVADMLATYAERRDLLLAALEGVQGVRVFPPRGTFFLWVELAPELFERMGVKEDVALADLLASRGIGSVPGSAFGAHGAGALRMAFSCDTEMVREGGRQLRELLAGELAAIPAASTATPA